MLLAAVFVNTSTAQDFACDLEAKATWSKEEIFYCCFTEIYCHPDDKEHHPSTHKPTEMPLLRKTTTTLPPTSTVLTLPKGTFDCAGDENVRLSWAGEQLTWCCEHWGVGCAESTPLPNGGVNWDAIPLPTTTLMRAPAMPFSCRSHLLTHGDMSTWSPLKHQWCCSHWHIGCQMPTTTTDQFSDCLEDLERWSSDWSKRKMLWCCEFGPLVVIHELQSASACAPTTVTTSTQAPRPAEVFSNPANNPFRYNVGGDALPADVVFDCLNGETNWQRWWSHQKKDWCCEHKGIACSRTTKVPSTSTVAIITTNSPRFDCVSGLQSWATAWSETKKDYCCSTRVQCPGYNSSTIAPPSFDCAGHSWASWSAEKAQFCCEHDGIACSSHYDCNKLTPPWSEHKKTWCCREKHKGCPFDCQAGLSTSQVGWTLQKKAWCCGHEMLGCPEKENSADVSGSTDQGDQVDEYDCERADMAEELSWTVVHYEWCCKHKQKMCLQGKYSIGGSGSQVDVGPSVAARRPWNLVGLVPATLATLLAITLLAFVGGRLFGYSRVRWRRLSDGSTMSPCLEASL